MKQPPGKASLPFWRQFRWNLTLYSLLLAVIPVLLVAYIALAGQYQQAVGSVTNQLESVATLKRNQIEFWLEQVNAGIDRTVSGVKRLSAELIATDADSFAEAQNRLNGIYSQVTATGNLFSETFLYNLNGQVLAGSNPARLGQRVTVQPYFQASLSGPHIEPPYYELGTNALTMMATRPIHDTDGNQVGVLAARLNLDVLGEIMSERAGLGETGETYLVSSQSNYLLTPSRFEEYIETRAYHSQGIDAALAGQDGAGAYPDYRGEPVIGVYKWIPQLNAGLLAEIDEDAALATYYEATFASAWATAVAGLIAAFIALYYANRIAKPIVALTRTAEQIAGGDLSQRAHLRSGNEIGLLAGAFNSMADQLQEFIGSLESRVAARTRDLALTLEVGRLATSLYTQKDLLTSLVNFIRSQFDLYYTQIYLLDDAGRYAILRAGTGEVGQQLLARQHRLDLSETSLVARAVQTNQPVLVADTQTSDIHKTNPLLPDTRSEVTIPLVVGGAIIGVLDMQSSREGTFNLENLPVFQAMASQIASALRGSQAFEEAQAAIQRAEMVNRRLTEEAWESYLGQLGKEHYLGYQYDLEAPRPLEPHSNGQNNADQIVQPVVLRGQPIGKIVIAEDTERRWQPEEMLLVEDVAKRVAQALDQFRAFDQIKQAETETRKRAAELQTVAEVSAATTTLLDIDDLLLAVSELTKERFGLYHAHIYLLDEAGENLVLAAGAGEAGRIMKAEGRSIPLNHPHSLVASAARQHKGVVVNDVTRAPDFLPNPLLPDTRSEMAVPMLIGDHLIGVLDVQASVTDRFTSEDVRVKTTLAAQVAVAVQNARAFTAAERRARELAVVSDVSAHATTILDPEALLHSVADLTASGFGLYHVHIYLTDPTGEYLELAAGSGEVPCRQVGTGYRVDINDEHHLAARAAKQRQSIINNRITHDVDFELNPNLPETRAQLVIPMISGDRVVGVLEAFADRVGGFTDEDVLIQGTLAAQVAVAVQNARAYMQTKQQATIIETSRDFISLADPQGTIVYLNSGGAKMIGYDTPAEIIGKPIPFVHFPEDSQRVQQEGLPKALETGYWQGENGLKHRDGRRIPVDQTIFVIRDDDGEIINMATIMTDITERKQQQTALERERALLRNLIDSIPDLIFYKDADGVYLGCNKAFAAFTGLPESQIMGKTDFDMFPPDVAAFFREQDQIMMQQRQTRSNEEWVTYPDGTEVLLDTLKTTFTTPSGELLGLIGISRDITERKQAEQERQEQLLFLQNLIDSVPNPIFYKDSDGVYLGCNEAYLGYLGKTRAEIIGKTVYDLAPKELADIYHQQDMALLNNPDEVQIYESQVVYADGTRHDVIFNKAAYRDLKGRVSGLVGAIADITETKRVQRALQENEARLAEAVRIARIGYWEFDYATLAFTFTDSFYELIGTSIEIEGSYVMSAADYSRRFVDPSEAHVVGMRTQEALETTDPNFSVAFESRSIRADGRPAVDLVQFRVVKDEQGRTVKLVGANQDITERKQAEAERENLLAEVQRNARLIRTVIDATPDWIFAKDRDYRYLLANQGYATAIGTTTDGIVGKTDVELGFPEEIVFGNPDKGIRGFRSDDEAVLTTGEAIYNPYDPATFADGSIHIFDTQKMPLRDANGETFAVLGFARDITLRQQQEEEVRLAREEAEILYQVSSAINEAKTPQDIADAIATYAAPPSQPAILIATFDTGDVTTAQYVNILANRTSDGQTTSRLRIPPADFVGSFMGSPDDIVYINDTQNDPRLNEETRIAYRAFNAESVLTAPLEIGGRIAGAISVTTAQVYHFTERDVRIYRAIAEQASAALERLQLIEETQKRAAELATVARVSAATTTILDIEELLQAVSDLTKESFHLYHAHIYLLDETGEKLVLAAGAGDAGRIMKAEGRFIPIGHPNSLVARAARERKGVIVNDVTLEPEFLPNPLLPLTQSEMAIPIIVAAELIGVLDVQSEITSRFTEEDVRIKTTLADQVGIAIQNARAYQVQQDAADRLREVDRLKSQFLANMSHELRTPLNSIIGYAEVMLDGIDGELTDDAIEDVQAIHSGGKHLLSIINDILDLAKIDAGQMFMDRQETDLSKIVEEVVHTCQILIKDKGIYLEIDRQSEIPPVYGDPVRLRQIVTNLVNNAIKFTEKGGITISIGRQDDQQVCVTVKDTGIGMSQKDLNVIFERFRQVDGSATRRAGGTGLGLAITRQLVQMHDGDIHVSSVLGEGSTFSFTLPVYEGQKV